MSEFDGGAAFPVVHPDGKGVQYYGMSLRDYFAAKAMQEGVSVLMDVDEHDADRVIKLIARASYMVADAMLKERAK
jgi:hypothetical protein